MNYCIRNLDVRSCEWKRINRPLLLRRAPDKRQAKLVSTEHIL